MVGSAGSSSVELVDVNNIKLLFVQWARNYHIYVGVDLEDYG
jgi:hypothetical protein